MRARNSIALGPGFLPCRTFQARPGSTPLDRHHPPSVPPFRMKAARTACRMFGSGCIPRAMAKPHKTDASVYANFASDLSTSFARLLPKSADDVADFLYAAGVALAQREADLARTLRVSRATVSSWKARGAIPPTHLDWFSNEFAYAVLTAPPAPQFDLRHAGVRIAIRLIQQSAFNPFGLRGLSDSEAADICAAYLGGLARLGLFVAWRLGVSDTDDPEQPTIDTLGAIARSIAPRMMFHTSVSQEVSQSGEL